MFESQKERFRKHKTKKEKKFHKQQSQINFCSSASFSSSSFSPFSFSFFFSSSSSSSSYISSPTFPCSLSFQCWAMEPVVFHILGKYIGAQSSPCKEINRRGGLKRDVFSWSANWVVYCCMMTRFQKDHGRLVPLVTITYS